MNDESYAHDHEFPDELISAYLDGELSAEDKLRVEEQLMDSLEHRRLFEELKALRSSLQALPRQALDGDFAQRVLKRAERELLAGDIPIDDDASAKPAPRRRSAGSGASDRSGWRGLVWSVTAMAAAVALIMFSPMLSQRGRQGVAVNDPHSSGATNERLGADVQTNGIAANDNKSLGQAPSDGQSIMVQPDADADGQTRQAERDRVAAAKNENEKESEASKDQGAVSLEQRTEQLLADRRGNSPSGASALELGGAAPADLGATRPEDNNAVNDAALDGLASKYLAGRDQTFPLANGFAFPKAGAERFAGTEPAGVAADKLRAVDGERAVALAASAHHDGLLVVSVNMTPEALAGNLMDQMLARHEIRVDLAKADAGATPVATLNALEQSAGSSGGADPAGEVGDGKSADDADGAEERSKEIKQKSDQAAPDTELLYVVASADQVDRLLDDLRRQSGEVLSLAYDHPAFDAQDALAAEAKRSHRGQLFRSAAPSAQAFRNEEIPREPVRARHAIELEGADFVAPKPQSVSAAEGDAAGQQNGQNHGGAAGPTHAAFGIANGRPLEKQLEDQRRADAADAFRGIARRLRLPEDFQAQGGLSEEAHVAAGDSQSGGVADQGGPPPAPAVFSRDGGRGEALGEGAGQGQTADEARKSAQQKSMRVLFVLRAIVPPTAAPAGPAGDAAGAAASQAPADE